MTADFEARGLSFKTQILLRVRNDIMFDVWRTDPKRRKVTTVNVKRRK